MSTQGTNKQFLAGKILIPLAFPVQWLKTLQFILPMTDDVLNEQLSASIDAITTLLATYPQPRIDVDLILTPITLVNNLNLALAVFEYNFNGLPTYDGYSLTQETVANVYEVYSIAYYSAFNPKGIYLY